MLLKQNKTYVTFLLFQTDDSGKQYERTYQKSGNIRPGMPKSLIIIIIYKFLERHILKALWRFTILKINKNK